MSTRLACLTLYVLRTAILAVGMLSAPSLAVGAWQTYALPLPTGAVMVAECYPRYVDRKGNLWVYFHYGYGGGGGYGLYLFNGDTWSTIPGGGPLPGFPPPNSWDPGPHGIAEDSSGNVWLLNHRWDGLRWKTFTMADGLGDSLVLGVMADRTGGVWFGTRDGGMVSRFDGTTWTRFTSPSLYIQPLYEDSQGGIWFGGGSTVARLHQGTWTTYNPPSCPGCYFDVRDITEDLNGTVVVAGALNLYSLFIGKIVGDQVVVTSPETPSQLTTLVRDAVGTLWVAADDGLHHYDGNEWRPLTREDGEPDLSAASSLGIFGLASDPAGGLWVGTTGQVLRFDGERIRSFPWPVPGGALVEDSTGGDAWFIGSGGVTRLGGNIPVHYTTADGLVSNNVRTWLRTRGGAYWFGTDAGVSRLDGSTLASYPNTGDLPQGQTTIMVEDARGGVWDFTDSGAARFDGTTWQKYGTAEGLVDGSRSQVLADPQGNVWVSSDNGSENWFSRYDGTSWTTYTTADGLPSVAGRLFLDAQGNTWALGGCCSSDPQGQPSPSAGLSRFNGSSWSSFTAADGIPVDSISTLWPDRGGAVWAFLQPGGLARYDGVQWTRYGSWNGATDAPIDRAQYDRFGGIWFNPRFYNGSWQSLLLRFDGASWTSYPPFSMIFEPTLPDLWVRIDRGLARFDGADFTQFTATDGLGIGSGFPLVLGDRFGGVWYTDEPYTNHFAGGAWRRYGPAQGLETYAEPYFEGRDGGIWFGTYPGLQHYYPDRVAPFVRFTVDPDPTSRTGDLSISFTSPFEATSGIEFSYRFDGSAWSPWSAVGTWIQRGVPDGPHVFEVRARDFAGNISPFPAVSRFEIDATPPAPVLAAPLFGQPVRGSIDVRGTAADARFRMYRLDHRPSGGTSWDGATVLLESATPIVNGSLASWDTSSLPDGIYDLRLSVTDSLGLTGTAMVTVVVDNHAPFFDVTAPVKVTAATGGDVFTVGAETHLYFPPHAFSQDEVIMVEAMPGASVPSTLPSGALKVLDGYELAWTGSLRKPARFTMSYAGATPPSGTLALYRSDDGATWNRLGGTVDADAKNVSLSVTQPGRYALFADDGQGTGSASLSSLAFSPRIFSPSGGFADRQVGIGFSLGKAAPVTVKVFSKSGRLVREVVSGQMLNAGANLIRWDGTDRNGGHVVDGVYLVTVEALGHTETKTLAVVK